jgi:FkbM family methyltransferase
MTERLTEGVRARLRGLRPIDRAYKSLAYSRLRNLQAAYVKRFGRYTKSRVFDSEFILDLAQLHDFMLLRAIESQGCYEPGTTRTLLKLLQPGMTVADVGANNGYYSVLFARRVGEHGQVLAFEPNPRAFNRLLVNVRHNGVEGVVRCFNLALSDSVGTTRLYESRIEDGLDSIVAESEDWVEVTTTTMDRLFSGQTVDVVKIDTEGSEVAIILGMTAVMEGNPRLQAVIEWIPELSSGKLPAVLIPRFDVCSINESSTANCDLRPVLDWTRLEFCNLLCRPL